MFYCRKTELADLNRRYDEGKFECAVIYGRKRVGKTSLISEFCKDKPTVFFSALNSNANGNLEALSRAIYEKDGKDASVAPIYPSFQSAFEEIGRMAERERLVFVIDEYPYLAKADNSVASRLQHLIDHIRQNGRLFMILCGSSVSFMKKQVLGYGSPLYGRRTAQYEIHPLTYLEAAKFNPSLTCEQQALIYGATGGIPQYINKLNVQGDIDRALIENFFNPSGYLFEEPEKLLRQELREPAVYNSIIYAVANGAFRLNEIASETELKSAVCSKYMTVLMDLGIMKKETPAAESPGKKTIYVINDNFFRFWYRFVPKNMSAVNAGRMETIYDRAVKEHLSDYMELVFEQMCREYLLRYASDLPFVLSDACKWWGTDSKDKEEVQIDIVGIPLERSEYIICSCRYGNEKTGAGELELLKNHARAFGKGTSYVYYIFSRGGFTDGLKKQAAKEGVRLMMLEDIYARQAT